MELRRRFKKAETNGGRESAAASDAIEGGGKEGSENALGLALRKPTGNSASGSLGVVQRQQVSGVAVQVT